MTKCTLERVDPLEIFLHGNGFYLSHQVVSSLSLPPQEMTEIAQPTMVISALCSELYLKCLICIETAHTPRGHHLAELFNALSQATRNRITQIWHSEVIPLRDRMWRNIEASTGEPIRRDLLGALKAGNRSFEQIRYSYEKEEPDMAFYISDLPTILKRVILEKKPEWLHVRRTVTKLASAPPQ